MINNKYIVYSLLFFVTLLLFYNQNYKTIYNNLFDSDSITYTGNLEQGKVPELSVIFLTSSSCPYSSVDELPTIIDDIKATLEKKADTLGLDFTTLGV